MRRNGDCSQAYTISNLGARKRHQYQLWEYHTPWAWRYGSTVTPGLLAFSMPNFRSSENQVEASWDGRSGRLWPATRKEDAPVVPRSCCQDRANQEGIGFPVGGSTIDPAAGV
jgi:hypothetical protein